MNLRPENVLSLLARCPRYRETPLCFLPEGLIIKDESKRMELGSFKALGGAYALAREVKKRGPGQVFCCASAGNHGLSVATGASVFGAQAVIVLAESVPREFEQRIIALGASTRRAGKSYEESMKAASELCQSEGWVLLSDSSWPGYLEIPRNVMEGYTVIPWECAQTFRRRAEWPTHVFLQAGVGGLAAAFAQQVRENWDVQPLIVVVEPEQAACLQASALAGRPVSVSGGLSSMGRLDCKEPSILAFELLVNHADEFLTVTDTQAEEAARRLTALGFPTTPSGAAGLAGSVVLGLKNSDRGLILVTEGEI
ncbi:MAG: pyridoxal-phosphate dependent enzyme [Vulcanimicrobiota bacterium]